MKIVDGFSRDEVTGGINTIDTEHHEIHEGEHFLLENCFEAVANAAVNNIVVISGAKYCHMTFEVTTNNGKITIETFENTTFTGTGTQLNPLNNNRNSAKTSDVLFRLNPTITSAGDPIRKLIIGSSSSSNRSGGSVTRNKEVIFKPSTNYLLRITNQSGQGNTNDINYSFSYYLESKN